MMNLQNPDPEIHALRVFLVEDSEVIRELIVESLNAIPGVILVGTSEGEIDALGKLRNAICDVLIVDIQLKQGNGLDLLRRIYCEPSNPVKVVLSNHVSPTYRRLGEQYGARYFFDKTSEFWRLRLLLAQLSGEANRVN